MPHLNRRFIIDTALNLITDRESGKTTHVEPRVMRVLELLMSHAGTLVSRDRLVSEIWNDYGGAEDGLNQAISFLRKALCDSSKDIIRTIPKKGYLLAADLTEESTSFPEPLPAAENKAKFQYRYMLLAGGLLLTAATVIWAYIDINSTNMGSATVQPPIEVKFSSLQAAQEENYLNTVTTVGPDSVQYRLVAIGDRRPIVYIDGRPASEAWQETHGTLISNMLQTLWARQRAGGKHER